MAQELASGNLHLNVDDFYFAALFDQSDHEDENSPVSDSRYAEELQFQEALMSSSITSQTTLNVGSSSCSSSSAAASFSSSSSSSTTILQASQATQSTPIHETLNPIQPQIFCGICVEIKEAAQMFRNEGCGHSFCSDCVAKHAASKIQDNIHSDHEDENSPVSDSRYAEELQFQEALMSSSITSQTTLNVGSSSCSSSSAAASSSSSATILQASQTTQSTPIHETLNPIQPQIFCGICVEMKEAAQMFRNEGCGHSFCSDCIAKHAASKIQDNIHIVACPGLGCKAVLELDACRPMLPGEVLERWNDALCEALVLGAQRLYCPFSDCSIVLMIDDEGEGVRESECPACHRLFCARCQVPWHPGVDCEEFQRLNEDERGRADLMVKELAKQKKWKRCPRCKFYVEKTEGCLHISCRCQFQFCYGCGEEWTSAHDGSCLRD